MLPPDAKLYRPYDEYPAKCLVELNMLKMSQEIRAKPEWYEKVLQSEIVANWKVEAEAQGLSPEAADYVIDEVKHYATLRDGCLEPGPVDGTWKADGLISDEIAGRLKKLVAAGLENVPADKKDYHPESDELVVDLVHPSLFCFVEDLSILVNDDTIGEAYKPKEVSAPKKVRTHNYSDVVAPSGKYRWMPAEVSFKENDSISFDSYINNLHPKQHESLYGVIGEILEKFIPLFNRSLTDVVHWKGPRIDLSSWSWYGDQEFDYDNHPDDCDEEYERWEKNRTIEPVPIPKFVTPTEPSSSVDLKGEKLQVIVKLANIELTPEKPTYGGSKDCCFIVELILKLLLF